MSKETPRELTRGVLYFLGLDNYLELFIRYLEDGQANIFIFADDLYFVIPNIDWAKNFIWGAFPKDKIAEPFEPRKFNRDNVAKLSVFGLPYLWIYLRT